VVDNDAVEVDVDTLEKDGDTSEFDKDTGLGEVRAYTGGDRLNALDIAFINVIKSLCG
jgi:hypothetical protein